MTDGISRLRKKLASSLSVGMRRLQLIEDGDKILMGISGGKDSLAMLDLLSMRQKIHKPSFQLEAVHVRVNTAYYETDTADLCSFAEERGLRLNIMDVPLQADSKGSRPPCFLCAWNRRKTMFRLAQELGCNKIALGHHKDDIVQTALMNLFYSGRFASMEPKMQMDKFPIQIIRPLYLVREEEILLWSKLNHFPQMKKRCIYESDTKRTYIRTLIHSLEQENPYVSSNIFGALFEEERAIK